MTATAMRGYYDMSGDSQRVVLAGYAATPSRWALFEKSWNEVLGNFQPRCESLHMRDAAQLRGDFAIKNGWSTERVDVLIYELLTRCLVTHGRPAGEDGLFAVVCTVELDDFKRAAREIPQLRNRGPYWVCAEYVTGIALRLLPQDPERPLFFRSGTVEMCFDRGERFAAQVRDERKRAMKRREGKRGPLSLVSAISEGVAREMPGLQAADYLAWHSNSSAKGLTSNWQTVLATGGRSNRFDYDMLVKWYDDWSDAKFLAMMDSVD